MPEASYLENTLAGRGPERDHDCRNQRNSRSTNRKQKADEETTWTNYSTKRAQSGKVKSYVNPQNLPSSLNEYPLINNEQDFRGQRLAEYISTALLTITGIISFLVGFVAQDIVKALYVGLAGTALAFVVVVPPWPFFNQNPLPWLPAKKQKSWSGPGVDLGNLNVQVDGQKVG